MSLQTSASDKYEKAVRLLEFMKEQEMIERISVSEAFARITRYCESTPDPLTSMEQEGNPYLEKEKSKKKCVCF